ncbi:MAG: hypothetical protein Fur0022_31590 [Anaerolineales bacterium]
MEVKDITKEYNIVTSDEFVVFVDGYVGSKKCLPLYHGFPASVKDCERLISRLKEYADRRKLIETIIEAGIDEVDELLDPMLEARERTPNLESLQKGKAGYVYLAFNMNGFFKIGKSNNPVRREKELKREYGEDLGFWNVITTSDMTWAEAYLHLRFENRRVNNEWFALLSDEVNWILTISKIDRNVITVNPKRQVREWRNEFENA